MRHVRMLGLCLVAALAIAGVVTSSAFAGSPEFGQCVAKAKGKYADANCQTKAKKGTGQFEWKKATQIPAIEEKTNSEGIVETTRRKKFDGEGGTGVLEGAYEICYPSEEQRLPKCRPGETESPPYEPAVECENEHNTGEVAGKSEVRNVVVAFHGCKLFGSVPCSDTGNEGEVQVNDLTGKLGFINKAENDVGILLTPSVKKGEFAKFNCFGGGIAVVVGEGSSKEGCGYPTPKCGSDGIIAPVTPVNEMSTKFTQVFSFNEAKENIPNKLEGGAVTALESYIYFPEFPQFGSKWSKAGESVTNINSPIEETTSTVGDKVEAEPAEIKA